MWYNIKNNKKAEGGNPLKFHLPEQKKKVISALLCGSMMLSAGVPVFAFADSNAVFSSVFAAEQQGSADLSESAYVLQRLGLVSGDENGDLMLDKIGTRQEAFAIFLALLGEKDDATKRNYSYTFRDVSSWFGNFAGYGLYKHYTSGYGETEFGANDAIMPQQYMAFVLKALNYTSDDFNWDESLNKAVEIGLCTQQQADDWQNNTFRRQEIMEMSYLALNTKLKNNSCTLTDKLIASGEITAEAAEAEGLSFGETYTEKEDISSKKESSGYATLTEGTYELHNVGAGTAMTANPMKKQSDVYLTGDVNSSTQRFTIVNNSDGSFQIAMASDTSLLVDVNPTDGSDAILWTKNDTDCQTYVADEVTSGTYIFRLKSNTGMALTATNGDVRLCAYDGTDSQKWTFSTDMEDIIVEDTAAATAKLKSIMNVYPNGTNLGSSYSFGGASQCMAFGREVFYRMFGSVAKWSYDGSPKSSSDDALYDIAGKTTSYSASSVKSLISKAKPGDILQMDQSKIHTMVYVSSDSEGFTVYDANWTASNQVSVRYVKYGAWSSRNSKALSLLHSTDYPTRVE